MDHTDRPKHWDFQEVVQRNLASYWPRQNQLFGIIGAPKNYSSTDYLFPADKLIKMSDYRIKGFPENYFRYPRIPYAVRDHFLEHKLRQNHMNDVEDENHQHGPHDERPDLCETTPFDLSLSEINQWKESQRRQAAEEEMRKQLERAKVLRVLQQEMEKEREKYHLAKERLANVENTSRLPRLVRAASPGFRQDHAPHELAASEPLNYHATSPSPTMFPPIRQSLQQHAPREFPQSYQWADFKRDSADYANNDNSSPVPMMEHHQSRDYQNEPQVEPNSGRGGPFTYQTPISKTATIVVTNAMPPDDKRRYLEELRQAAETRRQAFKRQRDEMRAPFVDTVTMMGADKPRWQGYNPSFHYRFTDVTKPGTFLQFF